MKWIMLLRHTELDHALCRNTAFQSAHCQENFITGMPAARSISTAPSDTADKGHPCCRAYPGS